VKQVDIHEAKARLSELVALVEAGERIVITRDDLPVVDLVQHAAERPGGQWKGRMWISPDFDAPLPEIEELFGA
jgi:prevent-host-death family protein